MQAQTNKAAEKEEKRIREEKKRAERLRKAEERKQEKFLRQLVKGLSPIKLLFTVK